MGFMGTDRGLAIDMAKAVREHFLEIFDKASKEHTFFPNIEIFQNIRKALEEA